MISVGVGGGMESMTRNYGSMAKPTVLWPKLMEGDGDKQGTGGEEGVKDARDCMMSMGVTSENVAKRYGVNREDQDRFAAESHQKASRAQKEGLFDSEIVKVKTLRRNDDGVEEEVTVDKDDGIRHNASFESMQKLKPVFSEDGASTAGNSSQISDGAAATLLMRRSTATELGLSADIIGKWVATRVMGCKPDEMGVGPAVAIPKLLDATGLSVEDVGLWEINEAFASQALYCVRKLGIDEGKVNPKGGAIARGHPLGKKLESRPQKRLLTDVPQVLPELYRLRHCCRSSKDNRKKWVSSACALVSQVSIHDCRPAANENRYRHGSCGHVCSRVGHLSREMVGLIYGLGLHPRVSNPARTENVMTPELCHRYLRRYLLAALGRERKRTTRLERDYVRQRGEGER